jgi:hypothetical protein
MSEMGTFTRAGSVIPGPHNGCALGIDSFAVSRETPHKQAHGRKVVVDR